MGTKIFYYKSNNADKEEAKKICNICPVKKECLNYAMQFEKNTSGRSGIWGGLTAKERELEWENYEYITD